MIEGTRPVAKLLMIATVGEDTSPVMVGVRDYPVRRLVLLTTKAYADKAWDIQAKVQPLQVQVEVREVDGDDVLMDTLQQVGEIFAEATLQFDEVIMNVSSGDKMQTCSALSAAFVNGIHAIGVAGDAPFSLPVLKFSYHEMISEAKFHILQIIQDLGGTADSLAALGEAAGVDKSLLSYHLRTTREGKGLEDMGLVAIERGSFGRLSITLTEMGRLMLVGRRSKAVAST